MEEKMITIFVPLRVGGREGEPELLLVEKTDRWEYVLRYWLET